VEQGAALVIIPTYNERHSIEPVICEIFETAPVDILVVDDGSPDGTGKRVKELQSFYPSLHLFERSSKQGLGSAYRAGFSWALARSYQVVIQMDADYSHHPRYLGEHLRLLEEYDFVVGSRYVPGGGTRNWHLFRRLLSRMGSLYARWVLWVPIKDFTGGYNSWRTSLLKRVGVESLRSEGYAFQIELKQRAATLGASWKEFPIIFVDRCLGRSKMSFKIALEAVVRILLFRLH
jgi:dolichol-phosphate mannosyltransferase